MVNNALHRTAIPLRSIAAGELGRYIQKPFPTTPLNFMSIRSLPWHSDVRGELRQRLLDGSFARIPSQGLGASSSWHHQ